MTINNQLRQILTFDDIQDQLDALKSQVIWNEVASRFKEASIPIYFEIEETGETVAHYMLQESFFDVVDEVIDADDDMYYAGIKYITNPDDATDENILYIYGTETVEDAASMQYIRYIRSSSLATGQNTLYIHGNQAMITTISVRVTDETIKEYPIDGDISDESTLFISFS